MIVEGLDVNEQIGKVGKILCEHDKKKGVLIHALQRIQEDNGYLPDDVLRMLSKKLDLPLAEIYSVATFYKAFRFSPRGRNTVQVCVGTACHVKGSKEIVSTFEDVFSVKVWETSNDMSVTLETVGCVGCCAIAPVVVVNEEIIGELTAQQKTLSLADRIKAGEFKGRTLDEED